MKIFSGSSSATLAKKVAENLNISLGQIELSRFGNGENKVWIKEDCQNETVFILQNFCDPVDSNIMQFCLMVDAARRMNPKKIIGVIPWLGYAKQNKVFRPGEPLAAEVVARIVSGSGVDEVILLDVHSESVKNFFTVPVRELSARELMVQWLNSSMAEKNNCVIVAPDQGAIERNKYVAEELQLPLLIIDKQRDLTTGHVTIKGIHDVKNSHSTIEPFNHTTVLMFDDMILSGATVVKDVEFLKSLGAADIYFFATHFCTTEKTDANLRQTPVKKIVVTNSLEFDTPSDLSGKLEKIDISKMFAEATKKYD